MSNSTATGVIPRYRNQIINILQIPQNKTYTIMGLTFAALIVFGAFAIRPTIGTIVALNNKLEEGREIEEKMQTKIDNLNSLQQKLYIHDRKVQLAQDSLPDKAEIDSIIANAELIAKQYNLQLISLSPGEEADSEEVELPTNVFSQTMSMSLEGNREDLTEFINHFEKHPRQIYFTRVGFTDDEESDTDRLNAEIIYFFATE